MSKPTLQKCYEKMTLMLQNSNDLLLFCVWDNGKPAIALGLKDHESLTPLAIMLDQARCDNLEPAWNNFDDIQKVITKAQELEDRTTKEQFDKQHVAIDKLFEKSDY
tara:strand:- start:544 stop:864 length:321 start_codon:yes stop_codon:yes gene_type:complete